MSETILLCEPTPEGIFSAIFSAYEKKLNPNSTHIHVGEIENYQLFAEYHTVDTDIEKAGKVDRTIRRKLGDITAEAVWYAIYSQDSQRGDAVYHTVARGLAGAYKGELMDYLQDPYIALTVKLRINVWHEEHHYMGFVRFHELQNGMLYSEIEPKNHVLPLIGEHFADRFPREHFMIRDKKRNIYLVHEAGKEYFMFRGTGQEPEMEALNFSAEEENIQNLFRCFCNSISIEARENKNLQQQMLPLRFRGNMIEFS